MVQRNLTIRTIKCIGLREKLCMLFRTIFNRKISIEYGGISIRLKAGIFVYVYMCFVRTLYLLNIQYFHESHNQLYKYFKEFFI